MENVMIRQKQKTHGQCLVIDLTGPQGNAFALMKEAKTLARSCLGTDGQDIINEMKKGDYEHLIKTFDKYFGDFVILER
tara:strand:+ start:581 stop:817 length:237 start_codon:yes stop_codon:yes gene_type:complete